MFKRFSILAFTLSLTFCPLPGFAFGTLGEHNKSIADSEDYVRRYPGEPQWSYYLANNYWCRGDWYKENNQPDDAKRDYDKAISIDPSGESYNKQGDAFHQEHDLDQAISAYGSAISRQQSYVYRVPSDDRESARSSLATYYCNRARCYGEKKDASRQLSDLNEAVSLDRKDKINDRADYYKEHGEFEKAINDYQEYFRLAQSKPEYLSSYHLSSLVSLLEELKRLDEARAALDQFIRVRPNYNSYDARADYFGRHDDHINELDDRTEALRYARKDYDSASSDDKKWKLSTVVSALLYRSQTYDKLGKTKMALDDLTERINIDPSADNYKKRASFFKEHDMAAQQLADLNELVARFPTAESFLARGEYFKDKKQNDKAIEDYSQAVRLDQEKLGERAELYIELGKNSVALDDLNAWVRFFQTNGGKSPQKYGYQTTETALYKRRQFYKNQKKYELALEDADEIVRSNKRKYESVTKRSDIDSALDGLRSALTARSELYVESGKKDAGLDDVTEALRLAKKELQKGDGDTDEFKASVTDALTDAANYYKSVGKFNDAITLLDEAAINDPGALETKAKILEEQKQPDQAEAAYDQYVAARRKRVETAQDKDKKDEQRSLSYALFNQAKFLHNHNKLDKALQDADEAASLKPDYDHLLLKGLLCEELGDSDRAQAAFRDCAACKVGTYTSENTTQAEAYLHLKKYPEALASIEKALRSTSDPWAHVCLIAAQVYDKNNNPSKATEFYTKAATKYAEYKQPDVSSVKEIALVKAGLAAHNAKMPAIAASTVKPQTQTTAQPKPATSDNAFAGVNQPVKDKWALVIGISQFQKPAYNLRYAAKDAQDFYNYLVNEAHFQKDHVCLLLNEQATRTNIMSAFGSKFLPQVTDPGDMVVVYISTHGTPAAKDEGGNNYVVAYDTDAADLYPTGVPMDELYKRIKTGVKTERALIILDTCFSGAGLPQSKGLSQFDNFDAADIAQGCGRLVISSSSPNERSWESASSPNGVFTKYLLQALRSNKGNIDVKSAFAKVLEKVDWEARSLGGSQHPQLGGNWEGKEMILAIPPLEPRKLMGKPFPTFAAKPGPTIAKPAAKPGAKPAAQVPSSKKP